MLVSTLASLACRRNLSEIVSALRIRVEDTHYSVASVKTELSDYDD